MDISKQPIKIVQLHPIENHSSNQKRFDLTWKIPLGYLKNQNNPIDEENNLLVWSVAKRIAQNSLTSNVKIFIPIQLEMAFEHICKETIHFKVILFRFVQHLNRLRQNIENLKSTLKDHPLKITLKVCLLKNFSLPHQSSEQKSPQFDREETPKIEKFSKSFEIVLKESKIDFCFIPSCPSSMNFQKESLIDQLWAIFQLDSQSDDLQLKNENSLSEEEIWQKANFEAIFDESTVSIQPRFMASAQSPIEIDEKDCRFSFTSHHESSIIKKEAISNFFQNLLKKAAKK